MHQRHRGAGTEPSLDNFLEGHDSFDVLIALYLASVYGVRAPGGRMKEQLAAFVVEHAQTVVVEHPGRGRRSSSKGRAGEFAALDEAARNAAARTFRIDRSSRPPDEDDESCESRAALHSWQLFGYDPGPLNPEVMRMRALFDPFESELRATLGFSPREAEAILRSFHALTEVGVAHYFGLPIGDGHPDPGVSLRARVEAGRAGRVLPRGLGDETSYNLAMLELYASAFASHHLEIDEVDVSAINAFVNRFSLTLGHRWETDDPMRRVWRVRDRPLLFDAESQRYLLSVPYNLVHAVAPAFEEGLRDRAGRLADRYVRSKGELVEKGSLAVLSQFLRPDGAWRSLEYVPVGQTQRAEGDGLIVLDSMALVLEAKAVELSASARMGQPRPLADTLSSAIGEAAEQAQRTIAAVEARAAITGVTENGLREPVSVPAGTRMVPLVVTLESLGAVTAALWQLLTLPPGLAWPVVVNTDDLEWFIEETTLVAELLHFLVVRQRLSHAGKVSAPDEADWFTLYRLKGARELAQRLEFLNQFQTKAVHLIGTDRRRGFPINAPAHPLESVLSQLQAARPSGWLRASFGLLDRDIREAQAIDRWICSQAHLRRTSFLVLKALEPDMDDLRLTIGRATASAEEMELVIGFDLNLIDLR